jgi:hypothetical protein
MSNNRIEELLVAFDEKDDDKFKEIIRLYLSYAVDNEVLKMANAILKSEDWIKATTAHTRPAAQNPTPIPVSPPQQPKQPQQQANTYTQPEQVAVEVVKSELEALELSEDAAPEPVAVPAQVEPEQAPVTSASTQDEDDEFADGLL